MPILTRIASLARTLFGRRRLDRDLDEELRAAVDTLADRYRTQGMTPGEAARAARLAMGGVEQVKEDVRAGRIGAGIESSLHDVRYAWRALWKAPAFAATAIITLALGIGANAAIYSVVHAMLLAPLPYRDADRLVFVWSDMTDAGYPRAPLSGPELKDLRERTTTCSGFGAIWSNTTALTGEGDPEQLRIGLVTAEFFQVLGAEPALGRTFRPEDAAPGARPTILLAWSVFQRRYAADPALVGRDILVNDRPATVIGVLPRAFRLLLPADSAVPDDLQAWQPFGADLERGPRGQQFLRVIGRMRPGVTVEQVRDDISALARRISREFSEYGAAGRIFNTVALHDDGVREIRSALLALFAGVGILLLIACVNVASLLMARAAARRNETALRLALGASRPRLVRQFLIEGIVLALLGGGAGLVTGYGLLRSLVAFRPDALSRIELSRFDLPVLAFTIATALLWGLLFSLAPLIEVCNVHLAPALQRQGRAAPGPIRYRTRAGLVVMQLALSTVLLVSAGLLVRGFLRIEQVDPGFRVDGVLTFRVAVPFQRYRPPAAFNSFSRELERALVAIPGVTAAGAISHLPYDDLPNWGGGYVSETAVDRTNAPNADYRTVTPGLFEALGVRLLEGRGLTEDDRDPGSPVVIVDERLAARMWPGRSPLGRHVIVDPGSDGVPAVKVTVVGVIRHLRLRSLVADLTEQIFFPERFVLRNPMAFVVRTNRDPASLAPDIRAAIARLDPKLPIYDVRPLDRYVASARATRRFTMLLAAAFAIVALLLACVGVYGVLSYAVARRRHEFGLRLALGAAPTRVVGDVMREGLALALVGCAAGLGIATGSSRLLDTQLYAIGPRDPATFVAGAAVLGAAAAIACWIPARRATTVSPMEALRTE
ncbi:MAG: permease [Acidobacteria bacterium]|nr:MAG: permease [Acidobacteriota bacterium]